MRFFFQLVKDTRWAINFMVLLIFAETLCVPSYSPPALRLKKVIGYPEKEIKFGLLWQVGRDMLLRSWPNNVMIFTLAT